jgi:hypothetical protein
MPTRSNIEITETSVVSLKRPTATFTMPGIEILSACGRMISRIACA